MDHEINLDLYDLWLDTIITNIYSVHPYVSIKKQYWMNTNHINLLIRFYYKGTEYKIQHCVTIDALEDEDYRNQYISYISSELCHRILDLMMRGDDKINKLEVI